jgi:signal transduction histidine kinase/ActR/RegA family two-component response regulator
MTERGLCIDWTAAVWPQVLDNFGRATKLTIQLFGPDEKPIVGPVNPTVLFPLFAAAAADLVPACVQRCLSARVSDPAVVESRGGISACAAAIRNDDDTICAVAVAGYALTSHLSVLEVRRLAARGGRPFEALWPQIRTAVPMAAEQLTLYGVLLRTLLESVLAEHMSAHTATLARRQAEAANHAKDEFLAMLAHELRNPLSAVRNAVAAASLDEVQRAHALDIARRQADQLGRLIDDLLDVARITQGRISLRKESVCLAEILERAMDSARSFIDARGLTLRTALVSEPICIEADPARLEQVFVNLLTNAAKFTEASGRIDVIVENQGDEVVVRVCDTGIGIAPEMLLRVWDLFAQAERGLDRAAGGLGIGLTIARRLVELHGGSIEARSDGLGKGAEFVVRMPTLLTTGNDAPPARPVDTILHGSGRVLLIEDNPDAAESLAMLLELHGHRVRAVHDGVAALVAARASVPDVMLVDIGLPGMNGYEVARRVREDPQLEGVVLVALTGYGREEDKQQAMAAGFDYHLVKPVNPQALHALVARIAEADEPTTIH